MATDVVIMLGPFPAASSECWFFCVCVCVCGLYTHTSVTCQPSLEGHITLIHTVCTLCVTETYGCSFMDEVILMMTARSSPVAGPLCVQGAKKLSWCK